MHTSSKQVNTAKGSVTPSLIIRSTAMLGSMINISQRDLEAAHVVVELNTCYPACLL